MYNLISAKEENKDLLLKYKLSILLDYANNLTSNELNEINEYAESEINKDICKYKLILYNNIIVGCLLINKYKDGILLDEIFLDEKYRGKNIGTSIIKELEENYSVIYLWVYKDNKKAISLYKKLDFKIIENTKSRFLMKFTI